MKSAPDRGRLFDVLDILVGERWDVENLADEGDSLAALDDSAVDNFTFVVGPFLGGDLDLDLAVSEKRTFATRASSRRGSQPCGREGLPPRLEPTVTLWPTTNSCDPPGRSPMRNLGPCKSTKSAIGLRPLQASRAHCAHRRRVSHVPCEQLMRITFTPASIRALIFCLLSTDGPRVATIFVRRFIPCGGLWAFGRGTSGENRGGRRG